VLNYGQGSCAALRNSISDAQSNVQDLSGTLEGFKQQNRISALYCEITGAFENCYGFYNEKRFDDNLSESDKTRIRLRKLDEFLVEWEKIETVTWEY
jgi:hypothetical protein